MKHYIELLTNIILQTYFTNSRCLIIFSDVNNTVDIQTDIPTIRNLIYDNHKLNNSSLLFNYFGCQDIIIKSNHPIAIFKSFEFEIRHTMERFNERKYFFIPGENMQENINNISDTNEINYVSNILILAESSSNESILLLTNKYVGMENNNELILLDEWFTINQTFSKNANLYPDKLSNQMGRPLKMATFQYEPYSIIGQIGGKLEYCGSEMSTAVAYAKIMNMTPVPVVNEKDYWGEIYSNWSGIGLLGNLANDRADIGFAALYTWESDYHFLDLSKPLVRTGITCLVPSPKPADRWLTPLYSFENKLWIVVAILFITCIFSLFLINSCNFKNITPDDDQPPSTPNICDTFGYAFFTVTGLFFLQTISRGTTTDPGLLGNFLMAMFFIFTLFLGSCYSSGLATIMTIPRYKNSINTVPEFVASGIHWGATQDGWIFSIQKADEPDYQKLVARFTATSEEILRAQSLKGHFGFSLERLPNDNYAIGTYIKEDVIENYHLMGDDFYWEQCLIMTKKSSILLPSLDLFILRVQQTGLISVWQNEAVALYMDQSVQKAVKFYAHSHQDKQIVKLHLSHVQGIFAVLCLGYIISSAVFLYELFSV